MKTISCIAIDDEPLALGLMVTHITKTPFLKLLGQFDNALDAMEFLQETTVQLIFLDIHMPDFTGIEFARTLDESCKVIFTTAYEKYAVEGFQLHVMDYLLKPISYEVFLQSAARAKKQFDLMENADSAASISQNKEEDYLFIKVDMQVKRIEFSDILYLEGLKDYVKLFLESSKTPLVFHATMKSLEDRLPDDRFMRIHRSYIVNLEKIKAIERYRILFGSERIPVSKQYKKAFDDFIKKKFL